MAMYSKACELATRLHHGAGIAHVIPRSFQPLPWKDGYGQYQYSDPSIGVEFDSEPDLKKAWSWLLRNGKPSWVESGRGCPRLEYWVLYKGMYWFESSTTYNVFGENPHTGYRLKAYGPSVFKGTWFKKLSVSTEENTGLRARIDVQTAVNKAFVASIRKIVKAKRAQACS